MSLSPFGINPFNVDRDSYLALTAKQKSPAMLPISGDSINFKIRQEINRGSLGALRIRALLDRSGSYRLRRENLKV
jgi:hypothetical protein